LERTAWEGNKDQRGKEFGIKKRIPPGGILRQRPAPTTKGVKKASKWAVPGAAEAKERTVQFAKGDLGWKGLGRSQNPISSSAVRISKKNPNPDAASNQKKGGKKKTENKEKKFWGGKRSSKKGTESRKKGGAPSNLIKKKLTKPQHDKRPEKEKTREKTFVFTPRQVGGGRSGIPGKKKEG